MGGLVYVLAGFDVRRIFLHGYSRGRTRRQSWSGEVFVIMALDGNFHEIYPDGQRCLRTGFFRAQLFLFVETAPHPPGNRRRKYANPTIVQAVRGATSDPPLRAILSADFHAGIVNDSASAWGRVTVASNFTS